MANGGGALRRVAGGQHASRGFGRIAHAVCEYARVGFVHHLEPKPRLFSTIPNTDGRKRIAHMYTR